MSKFGSLVSTAFFGFAFAASLPAQATDGEFHVFYDPTHGPRMEFAASTALGTSAHGAQAWQDNTLPWKKNAEMADAGYYTIPAIPTPAAVLQEILVTSLSPNENMSMSFADAKETYSQASYTPAPSQYDDANQEFFIASPVADSTLEESRGAGGTSFTGADVIGAAIFNGSIVKSNINGDSRTGSNTIEGQAFNNTSGIVSLVQNSGNNVVVQHATIVNLQVNE